MVMVAARRGHPPPRGVVASADFESAPRSCVMSVSRRTPILSVVVLTCVAGLALPALPARAQVAVTSASVGTQSRDLVYNGAAVKTFIDAAKARRVDIAGIGDSNQIAGPNSDYGWDHGYSKAWSDRFGWYGTGVEGMNSWGGAWNGEQGYIDSFGYPYGAANSGAPAQLDKYKMWFDSQADGVNDFPPQYAYFGPTFREGTDHWTPLATIKRQGPLWGKNLTWNFTYGTFTDGNGSFTPDANVNYQSVANGPRLPSSTG